MASEWFYQLMGETCGPVPGSQLRHLARDGTIRPDTLIRRGHNGDWLLAERAQGLFENVVSASNPDDLAPQSPTPLPPEPPPFGPDVSVISLAAPTHRPERRGLFERLVYLLDLKFERYLTPIIIRATWVLALLAALLGAGIAVYRHADALTEPGMEFEMSNELRAVEAAGSHRAAIQVELELLRTQLAARKGVHRPTAEDVEDARRVPRRPSVERPAPQMSAEERRAKLSFEEWVKDAERRIEELESQLGAADERLRQARAALPSAFELAKRRLPVQLMLAGLEAIVATLVLLWLRVILEGLIVLFNIVRKLSSIDAHLAKIESASSKASE